jgi:formate hydrogenlyase subunit 6/NADH:ubiquinone oxidoreductase subunit I
MVQGLRDLRGVLPQESPVHPELCIKCYMCARRCPDLAVTVTEELQKMREEGDAE